MIPLKRIYLKVNHYEENKFHGASIIRFIVSQVLRCIKG